MKYQGNRNPEYKPNDEFYTPSWIFEKLNTEFDIDVASPNGGISWINAKKYFTKKTNGLNQIWYGRVWMNPPFSQSKIWVNKFVEHNNGIALLPTSKAKWFTQMWSIADGIMVLPYDLKFVYQHQTTNGIFMPTCLFALGKENRAILENSQIGRVR